MNDFNSFKSYHLLNKFKYMQFKISLGITAMDTAMKIQDKKKAYELFVLFCICHKLSNI